MIFTLLLGLNAQFGLTQSSFLNYFRISNRANTVLLSWEISSGNTCNGTSILRGVDSLQMNEIAAIDGLCGDPGFAVSYSFTDSFPPLGQKVFYKIDFGGLGLSKLLETVVYDLTPGYSVLYENDGFRVVFANVSGSNTPFTLFDLTGRTIIKSSTNQGSFFVSYSQLSTGVVVFAVELSEGKSIRGKIAISR